MTRFALFHRSPTIRHFLTAGGMAREVCDIYVGRAYARARTRHTNDTHAFPETTVSVMSKTRLIASSARHLLVTEKKVFPIWVPP